MKNQERIGSKEFEQKLVGKMPPEHVRQVMLAYRLAKYGHRNQMRDDGKTRFFVHPKNAALILIDELEVFDPEMIIAELLHDMMEDSHLLISDEEWSDVEFIFGKVVANYVALLTKDVAKEKYIKRLRASDEKSQILKLVDRLHNVRSLKGCSRNKRRRKINETRRYFLPWARKISPYLYNEIKKTIEELERYDARRRWLPWKNR